MLFRVKCLREFWKSRSLRLLPLFRSFKLTHYPGDAYVDIGGASCYGANPDYTTTWQTQCNAFQVVTHRPACGLAECDLLPNPDLLFTQGAPWVYWLDWNSNWLDQNISLGITRDPAHTLAIYQNPRTVHLDLLPDWDVYQARQPSRGAYTMIPAEACNVDSGVPFELCQDSNGAGLDVGPVTAGQYIGFANVDFGATGSTWCNARVAGAAGTIEVHLDSPTAPWSLSMTFSASAGPQVWKTVGWNLTGVTGVHNVYMVFRGATGPLFSLNWVKFQ